MTRKFLTVEGDLATVDTRTGLSTRGSVTAPSRQVPAGMKMIKDIIFAVAHDSAAAGSASYFLRLSGDAVEGGSPTICVGAGGNIAVQTGSDQAPNFMKPIILKDVDIEVKELDNITIEGEMDGSDLGTARMVVTLVFA